jgi:hypothetical protein
MGAYAPGIYKTYFGFSRYGQGVSAPRCICTLYLKCILNIFLNVKKIKIKMLHVYLDMLHVNKVVSVKTDMFCALY